MFLHVMNYDSCVKCVFPKNYLNLDPYQENILTRVTTKPCLIKLVGLTLKQEHSFFCSIFKNA